MKFATDTAVVGLLTGEDETTYRDEVENLSSWCSNNNLIINHKNIIVDLKTNRPWPSAHIHEWGLCGEGLSLQLPQPAPGWWLILEDQHHCIDQEDTAATPFPEDPKNNSLTKELLVSYRCSVESVLTYCIPVWFASCAAQEKAAPQRVINTAQEIIGCALPSLE